MSHSFEVGKTYRNRVGEYVVQTIDGDQMTIRYVGGRTLETSAIIQARIWENIQFEEQLQREEEKRKLAKEARLAARKRKARAKPKKAQRRFVGLQESDFRYKKRGLSWSSREELGRAVADELGQRTKGDFGQWIVPRQPQVHVARKEHYDRENRGTNAAFFVTVTEQGVAYGFCVGKPDGPEKSKWPWSNLLAALGDDQKLRRALRSAMRDYELSLDVYAEEVSYGQVGQITTQKRGFLWQHETADQATTQRMNWGDLVDYLQTVAPRKRCNLYLRNHLSVEAALEASADLSKELSDMFEALMPVYDTSVGA
jgi:hypothetical protein